ncbi:MAG: hypothetical protein CL928_19165 [Deltaproteobacteria bacterium]|nr:hypothetical protein [Deltaproteobacteria bacterium]
MMRHPDGLRQGDDFRDEDWLHDIAFSFFLEEGLLRYGEFPLRTHLVGGGYPILGHPSDGSLSPASLSFVLLPTEWAVRLNLVLLLWAGTLGMFGLARRTCGLDPPFALLAAGAFAFSGWFPSFMLTGFLVQAFYLVTPAVLYLLLEPGRGLRRAVLAGLLLCLVLFQAGTGLPAIGHFLAVTTFLIGACAGVQSESRWAVIRRLIAALLCIVGVSSIISYHAQLGPLVTALLLIGVGAIVLAARPLRDLVVRWRPALLRLVVAMVVVLSVGAGKWVSVQDLLDRSNYFEDYQPTQQAQEAGAVGWHYQYGTKLEARECFYDSLSGFLGYLHRPLTEETSYRDDAPTDPEYAPLGLTLPVVALALLAMARARFAAWLGVAAIYLAICFGPNLPGDPYRTLVWGLPGFYSINQPYKYFNFFLLLPVALGFGCALHWVASSLGGRRVVLSIGALVLAWPLAQNAPLFETLFRLPATVGEPADSYYQMRRPSQVDPDMPDRFGDLAEIDRSDREHHRHDDTREFFNVPRGIGTIEWYADIYLDEHPWAREFVRRDGSRVPNDKYRGEAWCDGGGCEVVDVEFTQNTVSAQVIARGGSRLIINQNYDEDFVTNIGPTVDQAGLLAVDLPESGSVTVRFDYRPTHILTALWTSLASLLAVLGLLWGKPDWTWLEPTKRADEMAL